MESKEKYSRDNFNSSLLKFLTIRVDFSEIPNIEGAVGSLNDLLNGKFHARILLDNNTFNNVDPDGNVTCSVTQTLKIYRFINCTIKPIQEVTLDITKVSVCLSVNCNEKYEKIDEYIDLVAGVMDLLQANDSFVDIKRVGIRKIDGDDFDSISEANHVFENVMNVDSKDNMIVFQKNQDEVLFDTSSKIQINRSFSTQRCWTNSKSQEKYRVKLDIDGYLLEKFIKVKKKVDMRKVLCQINDKLFEIFKESVTHDFLEKGEKQ